MEPENPSNILGRGGSALGGSSACYRHWRGVRGICWRTGRVKMMYLRLVNFACESSYIIIRTRISIKPQPGSCVAYWKVDKISNTHRPSVSSHDKNTSNHLFLTYIVLLGGITFRFRMTDTRYNVFNAEVYHCNGIESLGLLVHTRVDVFERPILEGLSSIFGSRMFNINRQIKALPTLHNGFLRWTSTKRRYDTLLTHSLWWPLVRRPCVSVWQRNEYNV